MDRQIVESLTFGLAAGMAGGGITAIGAGLGLTSLDAIWPVLAPCAVVGALAHNTKQSTPA